MPKETVEEFLARGGKVTKSKEGKLSLEELLEKEGLMNEQGAKKLADLLSNTISTEIDSKFKKD